MNIQFVAGLAVRVLWNYKLIECNPIICWLGCFANMYKPLTPTISLLCLILLWKRQRKSYLRPIWYSSTFRLGWFANSYNSQTPIIRRLWYYCESGDKNPICVLLDIQVLFNIWFKSLLYLSQKFTINTHLE